MGVPSLFKTLTKTFPHILEKTECVENIDILAFDYNCLIHHCKNEINEKNVVGFISFIVMVLFAIADLVTSFIFVGEEAYLVINEVIYNSFVWVTLGCFGISSFEKVKGK